VYNHEFVLKILIGAVAIDKTGSHSWTNVKPCINTDAVLFGAIDPKYDNRCKVRPEQGLEKRIRSLQIFDL
jgi:isocitrate/isopropylmalate dehydrogenase